LVTDDDSATICARVPDGSIKHLGEAGWLHRQFDQGDWKPSPVRTATIRGSAQSSAKFTALAAEFEAAVDPARLSHFAASLGPTEESWRRLGIGWCQTSKAWAFPMRDAQDRLIGIRLRTANDGRKFAVPSSHNGLFIPSGLNFTRVLFACEGPTDTAALLTLGFQAIGRPSCRGGTTHLVEFLRRHRPPSVVIVADHDEAGESGAVALLGKLLAIYPKVRVLTPPFKDARAWIRAGATRATIEAAVLAAPVHRVSRITCLEERPSHAN
jgi:hypothetical protein